MLIVIIVIFMYDFVLHSNWNFTRRNIACGTPQITNFLNRYSDKQFMRWADECLRPYAVATLNRTSGFITDFIVNKLVLSCNLTLDYE